MGKLIDADELIRRCRDKASPLNIISKGYHNVNVLSVGEINRIVDGMPTVDAEPVRHGGWIPSETPPADDREVQICTRSKNGARNIDKGYYFNGRWAHRGTAEVTHWMELPKLPEI